MVRLREWLGRLWIATMPVIGGQDPRRALAAKTLHAVLAGMLLWVLLYLILWFPFFVNQRALAATACAFSVLQLVSALWLLRNGHMNLAICVYLVPLWVTACILAFTPEALSLAALPVMIAVTISTAWLLGQRWTVVSAVIYSLVALAGIVAKQKGLELPVHFHLHPLSYWAIACAALAIVILPLGQVLGTLNTALVEAQQKLGEFTGAQEALRESEARFRAIVDMAPDGIFIADATGRFIEVNGQACRQLGYTREQLLERSVADIVPPRMLGMVMNRMQGAGDGTFQETAHIRADGSEVPVEVNVVRMMFQGQQVFVGVARDITARIEAAQERARLEEQLRQAQKLESIGRLAGGVAHDFNNLLTIINGYTHLSLGRLEPDNPLFDHLSDVLQAGERAAELTRQLLAFSRRQVMRAKPLDLNDVVSDSERMLRRMIGEDVQLECILAPELDPVLMDSGQIQQVIMNLAVNARDAMPAGGTLTLETSRVELLEKDAAKQAGLPPGLYALLRVSDTGHGMDISTQERIFEPFFTTKEPGRGTGLGLSTVYGIVKQSGGHIAVESLPGTGTTFRIYLPVAEAHEPPEAEPAFVPAAVTRSETILLVEDEAGVRRFAARGLRAFGYKVVETANAEEAMHFASRYDAAIDLLLTDVVMPLMHGPELARLLQGSRPEMKVLYISGYSDVAILQQGLIGSNTGYLQKPFQSGELACKVAEVLGPHRSFGHILLVDDEAGVRKLFRQVLEGARYQVTEARHGEEALTLVANHRFDLLITDLVMPEREGLEIIHELSRIRPGLKIIAVSGAFGKSYLKMAGRIGACATLSKPVDPEVLLSAVRKAIYGSPKHSCESRAEAS